jgi:hypothetical protein
MAAEYPAFSGAGGSHEASDFTATPGAAADRGRRHRADRTRVNEPYYGFGLWTNLPAAARSAHVLEIEVDTVGGTAGDLGIMKL